jgi:hypothetical protein
MGAPNVEPGSTLHQEPLADYVLIRTDEIDRGDRLREIDQVWGLALGGLMAKDGQQTPIQVCRLPGRNSWTLVVGAHRHFGAEAVGIAYLKAEIVSAERDSRRLREIVENLHRRDLDPIDRAAFMAELVALKRAQAGLASASQRAGSVPDKWKQAVNAEADETLETISNVYGWTEEIGAQLGFTGRTVRNDLMLYRRLAPSIVQALREARHPVAGNASQLRALAKLEEGKQRRVALRLTHHDARTVAEAIAQLEGGKPKPDAETKRLSAFVGAWQRMSVAERRGALEHLGQKVTPAWPADHVRYREEALEIIATLRELVDGIIEDEIVPGERGADLERAAARLPIAIMTIAGNGFELGAEA